ncbi:hypothetical protein [uncultured Tenacibaculum sp.]|uniref:hypothetical protein n=1 Tax=uncultured Tenacibaculum sp. TaxID=174713 RepID=UPI00263470D1|nr:hypothetical protein [uncultured Tenacibaculum sp.]
MKNSISTLGKVMNQTELKTVYGGVTRKEYCKTLQNLIFGGGYQGDQDYALEVYNRNCGVQG